MVLCRVDPYYFLACGIATRSRSRSGLESHPAVHVDSGLSSQHMTNVNVLSSGGDA